MEPGQQFGSYRLAARIGAGGMGEVWKAEDLGLRRTVAIKILPAANAQDRESNERFKREARTAAQLIHPNIATIFSIDQWEDRAFIVMEYVDGEPLSRLIASSSLTESEVVAIAGSVADALAEAHDKGIVHRDVKPDNVVIAGSRVKVLDFGIAKRYGLDANVPGASKSDTEFRTEAGIIIGTVQYMSPEQAMGKVLDGRSDIFSLGVVMYEAITGELPFQGDSPALTLTRIIRDDPPPLRATRPGVSPRLGTLVMRCLEKDPNRRFQTARELAAALGGRSSALPVTVGALVDGENETPTAIATPTPLARASHRLPRTVVERPRAPKRASALFWIVAMVVLVVASIGGTALYFTARSTPSTESPTTAAPETSSALAGADIVVSSAPAGGAIEAVPAATLVDSIPPTAPGPTLDVPEEATISATDPSLVRTTVRATPVLGSARGYGGSEELPPGASVAQQAEHHYRRGLTQLEHRQPVDAYESFMKVVALEPRHASGWVRAGELALLLRKPQEAVDDLRTAALIGEGLDERDALSARFGRAIADGDVPAMDEACKDAPFDRVFNELRRMAAKRGAIDCPAPIGVGLDAPRGPGGGTFPGPAKQPRPIRRP